MSQEQSGTPNIAQPSSSSSSPKLVTKPSQKGYNVKEWTEKVVLRLIERDEKNQRYLFPDPLVDFTRWSRAHSWYKRFRHQSGKFYPILRIGVESGAIRGDSSTPATLDQGKLHWAFIEEEFLFQDVQALRDGYHYSNLPWQMMRDCFFHVSHLFSEFNLDVKSESYQHSAILARNMLLECEKIRDRITRFLLSIDPNPPTQMTLVFDQQNDFLADENEFLLNNCVAPGDEESHYWATIANRRYLFEFEKCSSWKKEKEGNMFIADSKYYVVNKEEERVGKKRISGDDVDTNSAKKKK